MNWMLWDFSLICSCCTNMHGLVMLSALNWTVTEIKGTRITYCGWTCTTRCLSRIVLYTDVDAQCDKLRRLRLLEFCDYARAEFCTELSHKRRIVVLLAQKIKFQHFHAQNLTFLACLSYLLAQSFLKLVSVSLTTILGTDKLITFVTDFDWDVNWCAVLCNFL